MGRSFCCQFSPVGESGVPLLATASEDQTARIWDVRSGKCVRCLDGRKDEDGHRDEVLRVAWSDASSGLFATGGADGKAKIWQPQREWQCAATFKHGDGAQIYALEFVSPSVGSQESGAGAGQRLLAAFNDTVALWDVAQVREQPVDAWSFGEVGQGSVYGGSARNTEGTVDVFDIALSKDGSGEDLIAVALGDGSVRIADSRCPTSVALLRRPNGSGGYRTAAATGVAFGYEKMLASCATDGSATIWDHRAWGNVMHDLDTTSYGEPAALFGCAFWPEQGAPAADSCGTELMLWARDGSVRGYDAGEGMPLCQEVLVPDQDDPIYDMALSPGAAFVAAVVRSTPHPFAQPAASASRALGTRRAVPAATARVPVQRRARAGASLCGSGPIRPGPNLARKRAGSRMEMKRVR